MAFRCKGSLLDCRCSAPSSPSSSRQFVFVLLFMVCEECLSTLTQKTCSGCIKICSTRCGDGRELTIWSDRHLAATLVTRSTPAESGFGRQPVDLGESIALMVSRMGHGCKDGLTMRKLTISTFFCSPYQLYWYCYHLVTAHQRTSIDFGKLAAPLLTDNDC